MIMTISIDLSGLVLFHLLTHALFKVLLFICAGSVIRSIGDSQDIRFIDGLSIYMPFTFPYLMVSQFALCGMPFLAGFNSKVFILEIFMRYVNMFVFYVICVYGLNSLLFFPFVLFIHNLCLDVIRFESQSQV
jgi:NADH-ubiquinone oxidoreductase chain 5